MTSKEKSQPGYFLRILKYLDFSQSPTAGARIGEMLGPGMQEGTLP